LTFDFHYSLVYNNGPLKKLAEVTDRLTYTKSRLYFIVVY